MRGIISYGTYIPFYRLQRETIGAALGTSVGTGTRSVAGHDEDTTSMGVEAARASLRSCPVKVENLLFSTSTPAYLDKSNATAIHSALGMGHSGFGADVVGSARSGFAALTRVIAGLPVVAFGW
jgi:hydroxymethylglutaryl-CoA synthase